MHGNWKLDNLGTDPELRTIVLDWELPGRGPAAQRSHLVPGDQLPATPALEGGRDRRLPAALERHGIATEPWWTRQLALCLLGALVQFGWEKAFSGYDDELAWWESRAVEAEHLLA